MSRYFVRPKARYAPLECEDEWLRDGHVPDISVPDHEPTNTGLLDANGDAIWRAPRPIGFGRLDEW